MRTRMLPGNRHIDRRSHFNICLYIQFCSKSPERPTQGTEEHAHPKTRMLPGNRHKDGGTNFQRLSRIPPGNRHEGRRSQLIYSPVHSRATDTGVGRPMKCSNHQEPQVWPGIYSPTFASSPTSVSLQWVHRHTSTWFVGVACKLGDRKACVNRLSPKCPAEI